jgi:hypothetical protein
MQFIGELCHFLVFLEIVTPLSRKPVILAVPAQEEARATDEPVCSKSCRASRSRVVDNLQCGCRPGCGNVCSAFALPFNQNGDRGFPDH